MTLLGLERFLGSAALLEWEFLEWEFLEWEFLG